jgi:hypothetical protein
MPRVKSGATTLRGIGDGTDVGGSVVGDAADARAVVADSVVVEDSAAVVVGSGKTDAESTLVGMVVDVGEALPAIWWRNIGTRRASRATVPTALTRPRRFRCHHGVALVGMRSDRCVVHQCPSK